MRSFKTEYHAGRLFNLSKEKIYQNWLFQKKTVVD